MLDVLYVGPYRQNDEWGYTSKALATLLSSQEDVNLVLRPVWFASQGEAQDIENIEQYENGELSTKDILIQHGLPSFINYNGDFKKNIAVLAVDGRIDNTGWLYNLNQMDQIVVCSESEKKLLEESGVESSKIAAFPFPPFFLTASCHILDLNLSGTSFYTVGSLDTKSGLLETLTAFLSTFNIGQAVNLIVACPNAEQVQAKVKELKDSLGIYKQGSYYPNIMVINSDKLEVVNYLHHAADFFIDVSYNAIPSQNLLRSIARGSIPIVPDTVNLFDDNPFAVGTYEEVCVYPDRPVANLWCGESTWSKPIMNSLREKMIEATLQGESVEIAMQRLLSFKSRLFTGHNAAVKEILCLR